jgi:hypothetical protein
VSPDRTAVRREGRTTPSCPAPARRTWLAIGAAALAFRLFSAALAFLSNVMFPLYQPASFPGMWARPSPFWDTFTRYDAGWYYQIARYGYRFVPGGPAVGWGKPGKIAYFPVYPLLMRYVGRLFGRTSADVFLGGLVVSWIAFAMAMIVLHRLARLELSASRSAAATGDPRPGDPDDAGGVQGSGDARGVRGSGNSHGGWGWPGLDAAERAVVLAAVFPFAFFFGVVYTESTFLLFAVTAFYWFRTRRWWLGGLSGGLAAATRPNGIMMLPALAWLAWRGAGRDAGGRAAAPAGLVLVAAGLGAYSLYVFQLTGHPFEWAASIQRWGYYPGGKPWLALVRLTVALTTHPYAYLATERMAPYDALNGLMAIAFVISVPFVWRRFGAAYGLYMLANLWLPLSSGQYEGLGRYCSVMFPFFMWLGSVRSRAIFTVAVAVSAALYALCLALFTTIHPLF